MSSIVIKNTSANIVFEIRNIDNASSLSISVDGIIESMFIGEFNNDKLYSVSQNDNKLIVNDNIYDLLVAFIGTIIYSTDVSYSSITKMQLNDQISRVVKIFIRAQNVNWKIVT